MGGRGSKASRGGAGAAGGGNSDQVQPNGAPSAEAARFAGADDAMIDRDPTLRAIRDGQRALNSPGANRPVVEHRIRASVNALGSDARQDTRIARAQPNNGQVAARAAGSNYKAAVANRMTGNAKVAAKYQARADEFGKRAARLFRPAGAR